MMTHPVPNTILEQLGGNKFLAMTGARMLVGSERSLTFGCMVGRKVRITLRSNDTYDIEFMKIRGGTITTLARRSEVMVADLQSTFTRLTGLDTHL